MTSKRNGLTIVPELSPVLDNCFIIGFDSYRYIDVDFIFKCIDVDFIFKCLAESSYNDCKFAVNTIMSIGCIYIAFTKPEHYERKNIDAFTDFLIEKFEDHYTIKNSFYRIKNLEKAKHKISYRVVNLVLGNYPQRSVSLTGINSLIETEVLNIIGLDRICSNVLSLLRINRLKMISNLSEESSNNKANLWYNTVCKFLDSKDVWACQEELMDNDLHEFAQL